MSNLLRLRVVALAVLALGCSARIELPVANGPIDPFVNQNAPPDDPVALACQQRAVPVQPLRRLSRDQYLNTLTELFGPTLGAQLNAGSTFPATVITAGFANDAEANIVNTQQSNDIEDNAERLAGVILAAPDGYLRGLMPCTLPATITDASVDGCIDQFIATFGANAYRRPITAEETAIVRGLYDAVRSTQSATNAWASVVQFFVQSPALLYRVERGAAPSETHPDLLTLTDHEMATRLSYLFLDGMPDATLRAAAAAGELRTKEQVEAQARRLLQSPAFLTVLTAFHRDWLHLYEAAAGKDPNLFPFYTPAVQASLAREPEEILRYVLTSQNGSISALLGSDTLPADPVLGGYYGFPGGAGWRPITTPNRRGLLTRASVMGALAKPTQTSPIHRGNFFRTSVLCEPTLNLPPNVDTTSPLAAAAGSATARERLAPLVQRADCSACHAKINPIGLSLENFDAAGQWRETENGAAIDASGSVDFGRGAESYAGPAELIGKLAASDKVLDCYSTQWFRAGLGRFEAAEDQCSVVTLKDLVKKSGGDLRELLVSLTQTDAFLYRRPVSP